MLNIPSLFSRVSAFFLALTFVFWGSHSRASVDERYDIVYERALYALSQGDRDLAISLLKQVVQLNPNSAGAWVDLGLAYCDLGRTDLANEAFQLLERKFQLPTLIQQTINDRRREGCDRRQRGYRATVQFAAGTASNANVAPSSPLVQIGSGVGALILELSDRFRPKADNFIDLGFQVEGPLRDDKNKLLLLVSARQHTRLRDYDFTNLLGAYSRTTSFGSGGDPALVVTALASQSTLAGQLFDQTGRLAIDGWINLDPRTGSGEQSDRLGFGLLATGSRYERDPEYNAVRFEALLRHEGVLRGRWIVQSQLGPLTDHSLNGRPGGDRTGWSGAAELRRNESSGLITMGVSAQVTRDEKPYSAVFFPGVVRDTRRFIATARYEKNLTFISKNFPDGRGFLQGTFDEIRDSISIFSYKNHVLTFGFLKNF